jgi:hypothetical protein
MPMIPLQIPPGLFRNGTELQATGRWYDANLVRWYEGLIRPVGGWRPRSAATFSGKARGLLTWATNAGARWVAIGTHSHLYAVEAGINAADITPVGYTAGRADAVATVGYGYGDYGALAYGVARPATTTTGVLDATTWALDSWGQNLLACASTDGTIYEWTLNAANKAVAVANAPTQNRSVVVTEERFVFALGAGGNARRIAWSDQENNTLWAPAATNQAGEFELQTLGEIVTGKRVRNGTLIWTDADVHLATYSGPPFIYRFERVGSGCGLIGANAVAAAESFAVWMSRSGFWLFDGYAKPLPSDVSDYVFSDMNASQASKIAAMHNSRFGEVWWFYPSADSVECNRYVAWNYRENHWSIGSMSRTIGSDLGVFEHPFAVSPEGTLYEHEVGWAYDGAVPFAESGAIQIGNGDRLMAVRKLVPDERTAGDVRAAFRMRFYPNAVETTAGPYEMASPTDVRFTARQVRMRIEATRNADWRVGTMRLEAVAGSGR